MRLLLTGGHGFTGVHVAAAAEVAGHVVLRPSFDLTDADATRAAVAEAAPTHVLHLGAISAVTHNDELALYRTNLFGSLNLLGALADLPRPPERVILASSANVYGNSAASPITEDATPAPVNHYAESKLAMEHLARAQYQERLPLIIARPFNYTGVGHDGRFVIPKLVSRFAARAPNVELGNLDVEREFNDVRVVSDIYLKLLTMGEPGQTYNICSGNPVSLQHVIDRLGALSGHHLDVAVNPAFVRKNEIFRLSGSADKLQACIGPVTHRLLDDTLGWMLDAAANT